VYIRDSPPLIYQNPLHYRYLLHLSDTPAGPAHSLGPATSSSCGWSRWDSFPAIQSKFPAFCGAPLARQTTAAAWRAEADMAFYIQIGR